MKRVKYFPGRALVLATLVAALAGTVLAAYADREDICMQSEASASGTASSAGAGATQEAVATRKLPRGSFIDAML